MPGPSRCGSGALARRRPQLQLGIPDPPAESSSATGIPQPPSIRPSSCTAGWDCNLVEVDFGPLFEVAALLYEGAWVAERYAALRPLVERAPEALHPTTARIVLGARSLSAADAFAGIYRLAELRRVVEPMWRRIQMLAVPTIPRPYTLAELDADPIGPNSALGTYTNFVNLLDLCALSVPGPFRADGLPAGTTLIAPAGRDAALASLGRAFQGAAKLPLGATGLPLPPAMAARKTTDCLRKPNWWWSGLICPACPSTANSSRGRALPSRCCHYPDYRLYALPGNATDGRASARHGRDRNVRSPRRSGRCPMKLSAASWPKSVRLSGSGPCGSPTGRLPRASSAKPSDYRAQRTFVLRRVAQLHSRDFGLRPKAGNAPAG